MAMDHPSSIASGFRTFGFAALVAMAAIFSSGPGWADWVDDAAKEAARGWAKEAQDAALKYADKQKDKFIKEKTKAAVFSLYSKLYKSSGANKTLTRALGEVALSAPELNKLAEQTAEAYGSGDADKIREASEAVAVKFGEQISRLASNQATRKTLESIIGSADKVREISGVLGKAAAGTDESRREAAKYLGETLIAMTPGAAVVGFYQSAYGAMEFVNDKYVDSRLENLYEKYKNGDAKTREDLRTQLDAGKESYAIGDRRRDLEAEKTAKYSGGTIKLGEKADERLTTATNKEVINNIFASFDNRIEKERQDAAAKTEREKAKKEADAIIEKLNDVAAQRHGSDWHKTRSYDLDGFTSRVNDALTADGVLDPHNPVHIKKMSEVLSTALVHGKGSKEHTKLLDELKDIKDKVIAAHNGAPCTEGSDTERLAGRLWQKGRQLVAQKKVAAAIPVFKQSLEFCPNDDRAAQLAELTKLANAPAETATQEYDGTYTGSIVWKPSEKKYEKDAFTGSLTLTIKGGAITGTMQARKYSKDGKNYLDIAAQISGTALPNGQITATIQGKSSYEGEMPPKEIPWPEPGNPNKTIPSPGWIAASLMKAVSTYPFEGSFKGRVGEGDSSGSYSVAKLSGKQPTPSYRIGTWKATRK